MDEDSRIEEKKQYNAPFLRALDYLMKEMRLNKKETAALVKGSASYLSDCRAGKKRVGEDYMKRLAAAFIENLGEPLNMNYLYGKSQYMLLKNVPDSENLENQNKEANPDYEVMKLQKHEDAPQTIPADILKELEWLRKENADLRIMVNDKQQRIEEQQQTIADLRKDKDTMRTTIEMLQQKDILTDSLFPIGVADRGERGDKNTTHV